MNLIRAIRVIPADVCVVTDLMVRHLIHSPPEEHVNPIESDGAAADDQTGRDRAP